MSPQCTTLLNHMEKYGSITGMESINLGVMNYKGRINDLRRAGFPIKTEWETRTNSKGEKKTYARYTLCTTRT